MSEQIKLNDDRTLSYSEYGDSRGAPVIYCHGFPGCRLDWLLFDSPTVTEMGVRVIAPDRPGYGGSDSRRGRKLHQWADDVAQLADAIGVGSFSVLGISGGAPYALACAAQLPDRVRAITLVSGMGPDYVPGMREGSSWTIPAAPRLLRRPLVNLMARGVDRDSARFLEKSRGAFSDVDAHLFEHQPLVDAYLAAMREALRPGPNGVLDDAVAYTRKWEFKLGEIDTPVELWHGAQDKNVLLSVARFYAEALPACTTHFLDGEGHLTLPRNQLGKILESLRHATV